MAGPLQPWLGSNETLPWCGFENNASPILKSTSAGPATGRAAGGIFPQADSRHCSTAAQSSPKGRTSPLLRSGPPPPPGGPCDYDSIFAAYANAGMYLRRSLRLSHTKRDILNTCFRLDTNSVLSQLKGQLHGPDRNTAVAWRRRDVDACGKEVILCRDIT